MYIYIYIYTYHRHAHRDLLSILLTQYEYEFFNGVHDSSWGNRVKRWWTQRCAGVPVVIISSSQKASAVLHYDGIQFASESEEEPLATILLDLVNG